MSLQTETDAHHISHAWTADITEKEKHHLPLVLYHHCVRDRVCWVDWDRALSLLWHRHNLTEHTHNSFINVQISPDPGIFLMAILPRTQPLLPNEHWAHTANKNKRHILLCHHSVPTQNASHQHLHCDCMSATGTTRMLPSWPTVSVSRGIIFTNFSRNWLDKSVPSTKN